ncbi:MAG TPA: NBR1-Ig-like domain-containing protein [Jatrophihabitantaceae bacterium]
MADQAAKTRAEAIEGFAGLLRDLRESVGNPAFREMSGRSRAISHTTLHEAAQGNRLPSWATTVEFVKACGAEPAEYRERWDQANRVVRSVTSLQLTRTASDSVSRLSTGSAILSARVTDRRGIDPRAEQPHPSSDRLTPPDSVANDEAPVAPAPRNRRRLWFVLPGVAAAGAMAVAVVVALDSGNDSPGAKRTGTSQPLTAPLSAADCPMHSPNPPAAPPAHAGDASAFIADITLPDCSHVRRGQAASKVWRLKNVGTVPWTGYSLHRLDVPQQRDQCQTISDIPIDDTAPGDLVDIRTEITAPKNPGFCFVRFKMVDASGQVAFPGSRPVNFQLIVD